MARRGTATVKTANKSDRYIYIDSDGDETESPRETPEASKASKDTSSTTAQDRASWRENGDPDATREQLNPSRHLPEIIQPRQASTTVDQSQTLANSLFPTTNKNGETQSIQGLESSTSLVSKASRLQNQRPITRPPLYTQSSATPQSLAAPQQNADANGPTSCQTLPGVETMAIQGGAAIPPNQQRNMRACMVCSIVRTQQQFMTGGCPNCEDILELAGNSEQINDCTSQVFDGLISVADTKRSWVARYQRLEGYVPGVYATQVEGILPEDVIVAVENAGINYVPRDGSEQDMLPKE